MVSGMERPGKNKKSWKKTVEKEHGGITTREYFITDHVEWYSEKALWKNLRTFGMVYKTLKKDIILPSFRKL